MQSDFPAFTYELLKQPEDIRLVKLHPSADPSSPVYADLVHASLRQEPEYEALSYTWGDPKKGFPEQVVLDNHIFNVTENLMAALRALRRSDLPRLLWIDFICINQRDHEEKGREVPRILEIYTNAARVLVWLGPASDNSGLAMDHLEALAMDFDQRASKGAVSVLAATLFDVVVATVHFVVILLKTVLVRKQWLVFGPAAALYWYFHWLPTHTLLIACVRLLPQVRQACVAWNAERDLRVQQQRAGLYPGEQVLNAVSSLFKRDWFSRSWTVQELVGAEEALLICGGRTLPWTRFVRAFDTIEHRIHDHADSEHASPYSTCQNQHVKAFLDALNTDFLPPAMKETRTSLLRLLVTFSDREAGLTRDKVYAFLGMSNEGRRINAFVTCNDRPRLPLDYSSTKTDSDVFVDTAKFLVEANQTLDVLHASFFRSSLSHHPSWAPDWTPQRQNGKILTSPYIYAAYPSPFRAAYSLDTTHAILEDGRVADFSSFGMTPQMVVKGFAVGRLRGTPVVMKPRDSINLLRRALPPPIYSILTLAGRTLHFIVACWLFTITVFLENRLSRGVFSILARYDVIGTGPTFLALSQMPTDQPASGRQPIHGFSTWHRRSHILIDTPSQHAWAFDPVSGFEHIPGPTLEFVTYSPESQAGDLVVMLVGAKMPMIIRRRAGLETASVERGSLESTYRHVGPGTFIHSTFDRRAWARIRQEHAEGRQKLDKFILV